MRELVDLGRHDEIALCQAIDLMRPELDLDFAPCEINVRMMPLLFGHSTGEVYKLKRLGEVGEFEFFLNMMFADNSPAVDLIEQPRQLTASKWWDSALAGHTDLFCEFRHKQPRNSDFGDSLRQFYHYRLALFPLLPLGSSGISANMLLILSMPSDEALIELPCNQCSGTGGLLSHVAVGPFTKYVFHTG